MLPVIQSGMYFQGKRYVTVTPKGGLEVAEQVLYPWVGGDKGVDCS